MKDGGRVSGEDQSDHLWARQEGEGQGRWQKAFGNHAPMAPHTLARNLGGACRADPMRLQAPCPHTGSGPSRPRLHRPVLPCSGYALGVARGQARAQATASPHPCQESAPGRLAQPGSCLPARPCLSWSCCFMAAVRGNELVGVCALHGIWHDTRKMFSQLSHSLILECDTLTPED